jgi:hypothetical protein
MNLDSTTTLFDWESIGKNEFKYDREQNIHRTNSQSFVRKNVLEASIQYYLHPDRIRKILEENPDLSPDDLPELLYGNLHDNPPPLPPPRGGPHGGNYKYKKRKTRRRTNKLQK